MIYSDGSAFQIEKPMRWAQILFGLSILNAASFLGSATVHADPTEVPDNAIEQYLSEDMKTVPDGVYIPYPEDVEEFKGSPLYKFLEKMAPGVKESPAPSGGKCGVNKKLFENV